MWRLYTLVLRARLSPTKQGEQGESGGMRRLWAYLIFFVFNGLWDSKGIFSTMAENGGFEPPIELSPYNGLANRRLQPLGQLSVCVLLEQNCNSGFLFLLS